ncbi:MarR family winged helix-turn-helix transcriptional regulator [Tautonia sociabilis]|nr:MarR family transcriptional regulator [Tautonia sociabilis]
MEQSPAEEPERRDEGPLDPRRSPARERFGFLLAMAAHRFRARFEEELEPLGVQLKHVAILATIDHFGPVRQQRLGESVCIDRASMVGVLDEMEGLGLVRRQPDPVDRRAHRVHLTDSGQELLRQANRIAERTEDDCLGPLSGEERGRLKEMLQRIVDPGSWSGFEHINIKVSSRAGAAEPGGGGRAR